MPQVPGWPHFTQAACKSMPRAAIRKALAMSELSIRPIARQGSRAHLRKFCAEQCEAPEEEDPEILIVGVRRKC